ncbi:lipocalin family protein [Gramella jeungdoensis]|uniref:Lipocalin family protein n=1 Tax=Gramella jeungdoensis TaxID=708091 RepID=A0ABT0YZH5_9FLAO|nr:lipocalin family protein [Gramella jeungdoensis]MCM8568734.1 lipocalin family protein [Gramella jeungdoensis]
MSRCFVFTLIGFLIIFSYACDEQQAYSLSDDDWETIIHTRINPSDLYGSWELTAIYTEDVIDINGDGTHTNDLLLETNCFDGMSIELKDDGGFFAVNAQMDFSARPGDLEYECVSKPGETGTWEINNNALVLNLVVGNILISDAKKISLYANSFSLSVNENQSKDYVDHPQNDRIQVIELEFSRLN